MADLTYLKKLTKELNNEIRNNIESGPVFGMLKSYFDDFETLIVIIRVSDKKVLYMNKATCNKIISIGENPKHFINSPCIGLSMKNCPLKDACPIEECGKTKKVILRTNVKSPLSENRYHVVCLPLRYNGVSAVIEMWVDA